MVESSSNAADAGQYYVVSLPEGQIYTQIRAWLLEVLPNEMRVITGQQNRMPAPKDPFATMVIINRERISTNASEYDGTSTRTVKEQVKLNMQITLFGPASSNQMQAVTALWRDMHAVDFFRNQNVSIAPLYTSSVRQLGFITGEKQYDDCWTVDLAMMVTIAIRTPQQFASSITITLDEVVTAYPATE